ncbi:MAG TPA: magnesium and cobalt transport protein CorA [Pseudonocardia sp.]
MSTVDDAIYVDGRRTARPSSLAHSYSELRARADSDHAFCWIGLLRPTTEEIHTIADEFQLHPLAVEDAIHAHQRPKLEKYGQTMFVVLRPARYLDAEEDVELGEIHLFLGPDFVLALRHADEPDLAQLRSRMEDDPDLLKIGPFAVLYTILDQVVDDYAPVMDGLQADIDQIEVQVFGGDPKVSRRIYQLSREVIELQRGVEPLKEVLVGLRSVLKERASDSDLELRRRLRDVDDHVTRAVERIDGFRELLGNIVSVNAALVAQRQNEEMTRLTEASFDQNEQTKRLSSVAAILYAPTMIAGIYGMNFQHMPELNWSFGYPFAIGLMVLLGIALYVVFRWRRWL